MATIGENAIKRTFDRHGHWGYLVRQAEPDDIRVQVRLMRRFTEEEGLIHEASQDKAWFNMRGAELNAAVFPVPPRKGDRIEDTPENQVFTIFTAEPLWSQGTVFGYRVRCVGG